MRIEHPALRSILTAAFVVSTAVAVLGTTADPDLWGHVRFGQDILASGTLTPEDTYSFTSDRPWINHEWLAEVFMALAFQGGPVGLNLMRVAIVAAVLVILWHRLKSLDTLLRLQILAVTALGILLRIHPIRPQLFSVLLFALTLALMARADERNSLRPIGLMPLVMMAWVNLHGGWIVGLGVLGLWIAIRTVTGRVPSGHVLRLSGLGFATVATTLINPYGIEMWRFLATTVRPERAMISDWQPMHMLPPAFAAVWLLPAGLTLFVAARRWSRVDPTYLALVTLLGVAALRVSRLDAFFTLAAVSLLAPLLHEAMVTRNATNDRRRLGFGTVGLTAIGVIILGVAVWRLPRIAMPPSSPEPEATQYVRDHQLEGNMLTWFNWGEYAIWHFGPRIRVSMDGRRETVYSDIVTAEHLAFYAGARDSVSYPDRIGADYIWLPRTLPIVPQLRARGWKPVFEGSVSVLLTRSDQLSRVKSDSPQLRRVFPSM